MNNKTTIYKKVEKVPILKVKKNEEETVKLQRKQEIISRAVIPNFIKDTEF